MAMVPTDATPWERPCPQPARPVLGAVGIAESTLAGAETRRLWALSGDEVEAAMEGLARIHAMTQAHLTAVLAEAKSRGLGCEQGWGPQDWARMHAPGLTSRLVADLDTVAGAAAEPRLAELYDAVARGADPEAVDALEVSRAGQIARFHKRVRGMADAEQLEAITHIMVDSARGVGGLSEREVAVMVRRTGDMLKSDREAEDDAELARKHRSLVKSKGPVGLWRYSMLLDDEGAAVVDAAVDALAKPVPDPETGERDPRSAETRRADALLELVRRASSAPEALPRQTKTSVVVTIGLDALQGRGRGAGMTLSAHLLSVETVRRLACDAELIPVVLGSHGEVLEQGRAERLFTRAQVRHLWLRDRTCTFPGCSKPATWCDAHHLIHWADGGPTDVEHAALLCQRHHTVVHTNKYAGEVVDHGHGPRVVWDLTPGSYHDQLARWREERPAASGGRIGAGRDDSSSGGSAIGGGISPPRP